MKTGKLIVISALVLALLGVGVAQGQDSLNVRKIGSIPYWQYARDVVVSGSYAYVASDGSGLRVVDVSNPTAPVVVGYSVSTGYSWHVAVSGNYAFVAEGPSGLSVVNISDPVNPFWVGGYNSPGFAVGVAVSGDYAYLADYDYGLRVIDVSNPQNPVWVGWYDTPGTAYDVAISGNYAFVADYGYGLRIVDITNPTSPIELGFFNTPGSAYGVAVSGNLAFVADGPTGLYILDITTPPYPVYLSSYNTPGDAHKVEVLGAYAYVANDSYGLRVINISNPYTPWEAGYYNTQGNAQGVAITDGYIYVADYTYFGIYQFSPPIWDINTSAVSPPVVIPANGGSFPYNINVHNLTTQSQTGTVWNKVRDAANVYTQVFGPVSRTLPGGANPSRVFTQTIAGSISSGTLYFISYIGAYPSTIVDSSFFTITKLATGNGGPFIAESYGSGDFFDEYATTTAAVIPEVYSLGQNYPNPFNPLTSISFGLPQAAQVKLTVFDVMGREVAVLVNGMRDAGTHSVTFDASGLASGIYLYKLEAGAFSAVSKMVLMK